MTFTAITKQVTAQVSVFALIMSQAIHPAFAQDADVQQSAIDQIIAEAGNLGILLSDIDDDTSSEALEEFFSSVEENPELFKKLEDGVELSDEERQELSSYLGLVDTAFSVIRPTVDRLSSEDWLQETNPELADRLQLLCQRQSIGARDVFSIVRSSLQSDSSASNSGAADAARDINGISAECSAVLNQVADAQSQALAAADARIAQLQNELANLPEDAPEEERNRIKAEIEEEQEKRDRIEKSKKDLNILKLALGLAAMVAAGVGSYFSAGTCTWCVKAFIAGAGTVKEAVDESQRTESRTVTVPGTPARYTNLKTDHTPSPETRQAREQQIESDPDVKLIPTSLESGNYRIGQTSDGNLVVIQIEDPVEITVDLQSADITALSAAQVVASASDLSSASWEEVTDLQVSETSISFRLVGEVTNSSSGNKTSTEVGFVQSDVSKPFAITVE